MARVNAPASPVIVLKQRKLETVSTTCSNMTRQLGRAEYGKWYRISHVDPRAALRTGACGNQANQTTASKNNWIADTKARVQWRFTSTTDTPFNTGMAWSWLMASRWLSHRASAQVMAKSTYPFTRFPKGPSFENICIASLNVGLSSFNGTFPAVMRWSAIDRMI